jgi:transmembrane sensor
MTDQSDNIIQFPGASASDLEVAAAWFARVTSGSLTLAELAELELWRAGSPERDRAYRKLETLWDGLESGVAKRSLKARASSGLRRAKAPLGWRVWLGQAAAAVLAIVALNQYLTTWRYDFHTAPGEVRRAALADGSVVYLKGDTALNAHVSGSGPRVIELAHGEAFFEVKHDAARPFTVIGGGGAVRDVGTGFSVTRTGHQTTVAVEHGEVDVGAAGRSDNLTADQQVSWTMYDLGRTQYVDPALISPWRRGLYVAERKPLGEVLGDLNEYYPGRIIVTSRSLAAHRVNAIVQLGHVDALLDALNDSRGISVRRWGPLAFVSDRKR